MAPSSGGPYRIACPPPLLAQLRAWGAAAVHRDEGGVFTDALKLIDQRLAADPVGWGDPMYPLRRAGLTMYRGLQSPLQVQYAVDEARRFVYVKSVALVFGFGGGTH